MKDGEDTTLDNEALPVFSTNKAPSPDFCLQHYQTKIQNSGREWNR